MSPSATERKGAAKTSTVHLLLGPEEGEKSRFIEQIRDAIAERHGGEQPEVSRFYAGENRMTEVALCMRNMTLFSRHRLVIVSHVDQVSRADDVAALVDYLKSPVEDATLILSCDGYAGEVDKKIVSAVPKDGQKIFWEMFENQKQGWVVNFFKQKKIGIEETAVDYLLDMVANNTRDMRAECERLALFFGPGASIGLDSVEQYLYHSKEENVFTLFDRLALKEHSTAQDVLDKILLSRETEAAQLVSGLLMQFRRLAGLKRMLEENYEPSEACLKLKIFSKKNQKTYGEASKRYTGREVETILLLLGAFEERFRSIKADLHPLLLHLLVYYIAQKAGQGAWQLFA